MIDGSTPPGTDHIVAYIDGGARGNPGPAGYGVRIEQPDGTLIEEKGYVHRVEEVRIFPCAGPALKRIQ